MFPAKNENSPPKIYCVCVCVCVSVIVSTNDERIFGPKNPSNHAQLDGQLKLILRIVWIWCISSHKRARRQHNKILCFAQILILLFILMGNLWNFNITFLLIFFFFSSSFRFIILQRIQSVAPISTVPIAIEKSERLHRILPICKQIISCQAFEEVTMIAGVTHTKLKCLRWFIPFTASQYFSSYSGVESG